MDDARFDELTRALATPRRAAIRLVAGSAIGLLLGCRAVEDAAAHDALTKCKKIKDKKKRKKCIKKVKAHNADHANEPQPECTAHADCDDGIFCTVDTCDEGSNACLSTPDDGRCGANAF